MLRVFDICTQNHGHNMTQPSSTSRDVNCAWVRSCNRSSGHPLLNYLTHGGHVAAKALHCIVNLSGNHYHFNMSDATTQNICPRQSQVCGCGRAGKATSQTCTCTGTCTCTCTSTSTSSWLKHKACVHDVSEHTNGAPHE